MVTENSASSSSSSSSSSSESESEEGAGPLPPPSSLLASPSSLLPSWLSKPPGLSDSMSHVCPISLETRNLPLRSTAQISQDAAVTARQSYEKQRASTAEMKLRSRDFKDSMVQRKETSHGCHRDRLPVDEHYDSITKHIKSYGVTCIMGETGCGKSSGVPQMILREAANPNPNPNPNPHRCATDDTEGGSREK